MECSSAGNHKPLDLVVAQTQKQDQHLLLSSVTSSAHATSREGSSGGHPRVVARAIARPQVQHEQMESSLKGHRLLKPVEGNIANKTFIN